MATPSSNVKIRVLSVLDHQQTEELVADSRTVMTPSQRVDQKLAACTGSSRNAQLSSMRTFALRRAK